MGFSGNGEASHNGKEKYSISSSSPSPFRRIFFAPIFLIRREEIERKLIF